MLKHRTDQENDNERQDYPVVAQYETYRVFRFEVGGATPSPRWTH